MVFVLDGWFMPVGRCHVNAYLNPVAGSVQTYQNVPALMSFAVLTF